MTDEEIALDIIIETLSEYRRDPKKFKLNIRFDGLGVSIHKTVTDEIITKMVKNGIPPEKAENLMKNTLRRILNVLSNKIIDNQAPSDDEGKLIIEKLYDPRLRDKYLIMSSAVAPVIDDADIISIDKSMEDMNIRAYILKIRTLTHDGGYDVMSIECSREDLELLAKRINEMIGGIKYERRTRGD